MTCTTRVSLPTLNGFCSANNPLGEGHFDTSEKPSGAATPLSTAEAPAGGKRKKGMAKKAKTAKQRLAVADGQV
jgi:hypothetical protein